MIDDVVTVHAAWLSFQQGRGITVAHPELGQIQYQRDTLPKCELLIELNSVRGIWHDSGASIIGGVFSRCLLLSRSAAFGDQRVYTCLPSLVDTIFFQGDNVPIGDHRLASRRRTAGACRASHIVQRKGDELCICLSQNSVYRRDKSLRNLRD